MMRGTERVEGDAESVAIAEDVDDVIQPVGRPVRPVVEGTGRK
jgi:hypothetical protein